MEELEPRLLLSADAELSAPLQFYRRAGAPAPRRAAKTARHLPQA